MEPSQVETDSARLCYIPTDHIEEMISVDVYLATYIYMNYHNQMLPSLWTSIYPASHYFCFIFCYAVIEQQAVHI